MWLVADDVVARFKKRVDTINRENARAKKEHMRQNQSFMTNISRNKAAVEGNPEPEKKEEDDKAKDKKKKKPSKKPAKKNEETMEVK